MLEEEAALNVIKHANITKRNSEWKAESNSVSKRKKYKEKL